MSSNRLLRHLAPVSLIAVACLNVWARVHPGPHPGVLLANMGMVAVAMYVLGRMATAHGPLPVARAGFLVWMIVAIQVGTGVFVLMRLGGLQKASVGDLRLTLVAAILPLAGSVALAFVFALANFSPEFRSDWVKRYVAIWPLAWAVLVLCVYVAAIGPVMASMD